MIAGMVLDLVTQPGLLDVAKAKLEDEKIRRGSVAPATSTTSTP